MEKLSSVADLLRLAEKHYKNPKAMADKVGDSWVYTSQEILLLNIKAIALWLKKAGIRKGDNIGILALPSARWTTVDLACMAIGAVTVPLFGNVSNENFLFECRETDIKTIFVSGEEQWKMWKNHENLFDRTLSLDTSPYPETIFRFEEALEEGSVLFNEDPDAFDKLLNLISPDDLATIIYTSGSTGLPKGVMLTNRNLLGITHVNPLDWNRETDRYLSILPLAHVFGRSVNFIMLHWGVPIYYFNDLKNVGIACKEIHPTIVSMVPRLLEKIYAKMVDNVSHAGFLKKTIGHWAFSLANEEQESLYKTLMHNLADKIVYNHLREALGGALRVVISGGAALNPHLCHFFIDIGVPIFEGYGMTEASIISANNLTLRKIGSVGPPIEGITVKTSEEGEVLVKGPIVFSGYYQNPERTREAFTSDGWLKTGDKAVIDEQGCLNIIGRVKELFKSSVGEYIAPVPIEQQLSLAPIVDLAMIVAEKRKFVSCLLFPDFGVLQSLKKAQHAEEISDEAFLQSDYIQTQMKQVIEKINAHLNRWEQIRDFRFIPHPPTIETGELTPSMKIRREVVQEKYKELIDIMYTETNTQMNSKEAIL